MVKTDEGRYQQAAEQLRQLVQQKQVTSHLMPQIQNTLPTLFSQVAKQLYEATQEQQQNQNQHQRSMIQSHEQQQRLDQLVGDYQQYKQLMKRLVFWLI